MGSTHTTGSLLDDSVITWFHVLEAGRLGEEVTVIFSDREVPLKSQALRKGAYGTKLLAVLNVAVVLLHMIGTPSGGAMNSCPHVPAICNKKTQVSMKTQTRYWRFLSFIL